MKLSQILLAALAVMLFFAIAPLASAGDGTQADPYELLYVYADWDGYPFDTYPDLNTPGLAVYNGVYVNVTSMAGYAPNSYWSAPSTEFSAAAANDYEPYDIVFVDMVNMYNGVFATGAKNAADNDTLLVSIRTGPNNNTCLMPKGFAIRDTPALSAVLATGMPNDYEIPALTTDFFNVHDNGPGAAGTATYAESVAVGGFLVSYV